MRPPLQRTGTAAAARLRPDRQTVLLTAFSATLAVPAVLLWAGPVQHLAGPTAGHHLPWLVLAAAFLLSEVAVVHYDFRSEAHSFSINELPLVFGLFFASPGEVVSAHVAGAAVALVLHRRQVGLKLVFNLAQFALGTCLAVLVFCAVRSAWGEQASTSWGALLAAVVSSAMSTLAIFAAIALYERGAQWRRLPEQLTLALLATVGAGSLAVLGAQATVRDGAAFLLLATPAATFLLAYRGYVRQRQEHDSLEFLYESALLLDSAPDLRSALGALLRGACRTFRVEVAQFALTDDDGTALLVSATGTDVQTARAVPVTRLDALLQHAMRSDEAQLMTFRPPLPGPDGHVLREVMVAPVGASTATPGAVLLGNRLGTGAFTAEQLRLFRTLVSQVDVSLDNGRLAQVLGEARTSAERERRNSLDLQRGLLPARLPERDDVSLAVRYQPSGVGAEIGGDWYDVLVLPSGALGVVIGDVIGHDLRSAARMAQARSALRAYASEGHEPQQVVQRLNRLLVQTDPDFMGTCCYLEVRPDRSTVTCVLAGHPPPLLLPTGGRPLLLDVEPGLPLGVDEDAAYPATTLRLPPQAALVLYTDGLVESRVTALGDGLERITHLEGLTAGAGVEAIADRLLASIPEGETGDDVALLVLRALTRAGEPPRPRTADEPARRAALA